MASTLDKITDTRNAARPNSARVSSGRNASGVTLACDNLTGWPTASKVHFVTYQIDSNSEPVAGTQLDCSGIVSGNNIGSFTVLDGTDTGNNVGDVVEMLPTAAWAQDLADALLAQHSRTGAHVGIVNTGGITTDTLTTGTLAVTGTSVHTGATELDGAISGAGYSMATMSNPYKFSAYRNSALTSSNSLTKIAFDNEKYDTNNNFASGTYTAPVSGFYHFSALAGNTSAGTTLIQAMLYKNGISVKHGSSAGNNTTNGADSYVSGDLQLTVGDTVEVYFIGGAGSVMGVGPEACYFDGHLISKT